MSGKKRGLVLICILGASFLLYYFLEQKEQKRQTPLPTGLHPAVVAGKNKLISQAKAKGISLLVTDGFRSSAKQNQLYAKGRSEKGNIVTTARGGESYHNYGLAIDFALRKKDGSVVWDMRMDENKNGLSDWMEVVKLAKRLGFSWGGDWEFKDYPHLQMEFGLSITELQNGERVPETQRRLHD
ncbi:peptidase M15B and M15C DD-carboxypeptidase VanY/endolysin [Fictibacillus macauensis ZFHKF-1]|uniref:Peptidase M15B and M15C DD-carboxypeptidase VanY/endolysin n=1 Tax=Fictibacillus macauensis ZFHKF-1 TaxID=1196324 RepID=I8UD80_9BACL|nr:M15 family metallopeptidase [Fictibacillus macauensis]EIT84768.1 peptidase M15B and M15C DD-carboxypeptidase VanY/endolysin [Fictibacillus macauensis ZFHKF-1]